MESDFNLQIVMRRQEPLVRIYCKELLAKPGIPIEMTADIPQIR